MKNLLNVLFSILVAVPLLLYPQNDKSGNKEWSEGEIDALMAKSELIPIQVTGDKNNRINVVIMNQWTSRDTEPYNSPELRSEFIKDIEESLIAALTYGDSRAHTAYANYKEFFNVYGLWVPDVPEWGKGIGRETVDKIRDKLFLPWQNEHTGWVTFLIMPNRDKGGGGAARNLEKRYGTAVIAGNAIGKMLHEISHTCMSLGDEYTTAVTGTGAFPTYAADLEYERDKIKWRKWIDSTTPLPTPYTVEYLDKVGAFEGNQYHLVDYYRSTAQGCIMGAGVFDNTEEMCPVCNQRVAMRVYDLVDPVKSFSPQESKIEIDGVKKIHFSVDYIKPEPNTQVVRWFLNGKMIASGVDELEVEFGAISEYELICSITDETDYIRPDPPFARFPRVEVEWKITNTSALKKAKPLSVSFDTKLTDKKNGSYMVEADVKGGVPPYTFQWSNGETGKTLKDVGAGIFELTVIDSEYRSTKAGYDSYASTVKNGTKSKSKKRNGKAVVKVDIAIQASDISENNGTIALHPSGGSAPYTVLWKNAGHKYGPAILYEPDNAIIKAVDHSFKHFFSASNNTYVDFKGNEGSISWEVKVARSGFYPVDIVYGGINMKGSSAELSINGKDIKEAVRFNQTRPLYTGWDVATTKVFLNEGGNIITLASNGQSIPNINYLRVPSVVETISVSKNERVGLKPDTYHYVVMDSENNSVVGEVEVPEAYPFKISNINLKNGGVNGVEIENPVNGYVYKWYEKDAPKARLEHFEAPLALGTSFWPPHEGTYYVAAQNKSTHAESSNRIGFAVDDMAHKRQVEISPAELDDASVKLWFDATDIDGNGKPDETYPDRGPVKAWKDKSRRRSPNELFIKYEPNMLNGKGVAAFDHVWVSIMKEEVKDYQTLILVYRENSMSFPGTALFKGLNDLIGTSKDTGKAIFDAETIDSKTKNGEIYLNGEKVDPFNTPNPMAFSTLVVQLQSPSDVPIARTEGLWEGEIAEMLLIDRKLSDWERKGIEEYLRRKWLSTVDVKF